MSERTEVLAIAASEDVVRVRQAVREASIRLGFSLVEQTKVVTAASELARNALEHGFGGEARLTVLDDGRRGMRIEFVDRGPGISDVAMALKDGYSTKSGLGLGLSGARRLSDDFRIDSEPGRGTSVTIVKWKR